jgi:large conductance mechanosensitive channel
MIREFKEFITKGNVLDLAVGVIIGAAFGKIVTSMTEELIMPIVGLVTGGTDFSSKYTILSGSAPAGATLAAARAAGANVFAWGSFVTSVINFLILAFVIFQIVRLASRLMPPAVEVPAGPSEVELLTEIRDSLKK